MKGQFRRSVTFRSLYNLWCFPKPLIAHGVHTRVRRASVRHIKCAIFSVLIKTHKPVALTPSGFHIWAHVLPLLEVQWENLLSRLHVLVEPPRVPYCSWPHSLSISFLLGLCQPFSFDGVILFLLLGSYMWTFGVYNLQKELFNRSFQMAAHKIFGILLFCTSLVTPELVSITLW